MNVKQKVLTSEFNLVKLYVVDGVVHKYKGKEKKVLEFDYSKLRGRIVEKYGSYAAFYRLLDITETQASKKLNGKAGFSQEDIIQWCKLLDIETQDIGVYFFYPKGLT